MYGVKKLQPNSEYEVYVVNPMTTKFGTTYVIFDHVHKQHFIVPTKVKKYIEANKINEIAEFTPKNVQTRDERTRLVYGVKVKFDNPDLILKAGMTIESSLLPDE